MVGNDDLFVLQPVKAAKRGSKYVLKYSLNVSLLQSFQHFVFVRSVVEHMDICMPSHKQLAVIHQVFMSVVDRLI